MDDKISHIEFKQLLRSIPSLSIKERQYLDGAFSHELTNGINRLELKRRIHDLEHNPADMLDHAEVEKVKQKLLGSL